MVTQTGSSLLFPFSKLVSFISPAHPHLHPPPPISPLIISSTRCQARGRSGSEPKSMTAIFLNVKIDD